MNTCTTQANFFQRPGIPQQAKGLGIVSILFTIIYAFIALLAFVNIGVSIQYVGAANLLQWGALILPYLSFSYSIFLTVKVYSSFEEMYGTLIVVLFLANMLAIWQYFLL